MYDYPLTQIKNVLAYEIFPYWGLDPNKEIFFIYSRLLWYNVQTYFIRKILKMCLYLTK